MTVTCETNHIAPRSLVRYRPFYKDGSEIQELLRECVSPGEITKSKRSSLGKRTSVPPISQHSGHHYVIICAAMILTIIGIWLAQLLWIWGVTLVDDIRYGRPRTLHMEAFVGHEAGNIPSHFVVTNIGGQAYIVELPGGNKSQEQIYKGPRLQGTGAELVPVVLKFVAGKEGKYPDMVVEMGNVRMYFENREGKFVAINDIVAIPADH